MLEERASEAFFMSVAPSGNLVITKQQNYLTLSQLDLTVQPSPTYHDLWSLPVPDPQHMHLSLGCQFALSQDETLIAVKFAPTDNSEDVELMLAIR